MINFLNISNFIKSKFSCLKKEPPIELTLESGEKIIIHTEVEWEPLPEEVDNKVRHPNFRKKRAKRKKPLVADV